MIVLEKANLDPSFTAHSILCAVFFLNLHTLTHLLIQLSRLAVGLSSLLCVRLMTCLLLDKVGLTRISLADVQFIFGYCML